MLDLKNLKENYQLLIRYMNEGEHKYSESYIAGIELEIKKLLESDILFKSYEDYYLYRVKQTRSTKIYTFPFKSYINTIKNFDLYNHYPDGKIFEHQLFEDQTNSKVLSFDFQNVIDCYIKLSDPAVRNEKTRNDQLSEARHFFEAVQDHNIFTLDDINEKTIISYFVNGKNEIIRGYSCRYRLRNVLVTASAEIAECTRIVELIPELKEHRKNIQYITHDELNRLKDILLQKHDNISYRDTSVLALLIYTGLRAVDIANIKLSDIDWDNEVLQIMQSKTKYLVDIPVIPILGNLLYNYLVKERPESVSPYLFVQENFINTKLSSNAMIGIINKVMKTAKIRMDKGDRKGTHIFRHHIASSMLENEVPAPVISATLGHAYPESLEDYVRTDFVHLKECALSIEDFPVYEKDGD